MRLVAFLPIGILLLACGAAEKKTEIKSDLFQDPVITVARGTMVTWTSLDGGFHDVTSVDEIFKSPGLRRGAVYSHRFEDPGTFAYLCTIHPSMTGSVVVQ